MNKPHLFPLMSQDQRRLTVKHFDADGNESVVCVIQIVGDEAEVTMHDGILLGARESRS